MYIIIAFACIYQDSIEVSGQILIMHICCNDRNLDFNLILALCDLLQYIYICFFHFQIWNSLPGVSCKMCSTAESCRDTTKQPGSLKTHSCMTWMTVEFFFLRPDLCLGSVLRQWVDSTSSCTMYNSTRVSVKVVQVIVVLVVKWRRLDWFLMTWQFLVTKNQS